MSKLTGNLKNTYIGYNVVNQSDPVKLLCSEPVDSLETGIGLTTHSSILLGGRRRL
jgi:hypothetical protein